MTIVDITYPQDCPCVPLRVYIAFDAEQAAADYRDEFGALPEVVYRRTTGAGHVTVYIPLPPGMATADVAEAWHG